MDSTEPRHDVLAEPQTSPESHNASTPSASMSNEEKQQHEADRASKKVSAFQGLGWLDRLLAVWILLAMIIGVLLGNFVENVGPALQKGKFVGVSIPIGKLQLIPVAM
jgi:ACR3 family arsenite transporter